MITERIPQREALRIARSSDGLLLLQPQSTTQVPGKLFEYLQIGRPILAFIQPASPSERLIAQSGVPYRCVYPGRTPEAIDDAVAEFFSLPSTAVVANAWFEEQFNAENQTRKLDAIIRSLYEPSGGHYVTPQDVFARRPTEIHAARDRELEEALRQQEIRRTAASILAHSLKALTRPLQVDQITTRDATNAAR